LKEDFYGSREMGDRAVKEDREKFQQQDRHSRSHSSHGHGGSNRSSGGSASGDGKRAHSAKITQSSGTQQLQQQQQPNFGYVRRSTGSGIGGSGHSVSNTKYSIPVNGNGKMSLGGMKDMLTAEELKAAHAAYAIAASGGASPASPYHGSNPHVSPYSVITTAGQSSSPSPKIRTKVKVSGGTQTTNDLHELSSQHQQHTLGQSHHHHHHHPGQHYSGHYGMSGMASGSEAEYASSTCSRNSGSFSGGIAYKSLSLTTPTATQLSQSLRERILGSHSLPKGATAADYAALLAAIQNQEQQIYGTPNTSKDRMSRYLNSKAMMMNDGSMSDNDVYSNLPKYAQMQGYGGMTLPSGAGSGHSNSSPYSWMRHSTGYASSITSAPTRLMGGKTKIP
jgi:hypothetical protein